MFALRVGDEHHVGAHHVGELRHFARMIHPGFDEPHAVARLHRKKRVRDAEFVVEVSLRRPEGVAEGFLQNGGEHLRGRRLAVAADDREHGTIKPATALRRQQHVRPARIGNDELRHVDGRFAFDDGRDGARLSHSRQKVVRVKALAAQGDEDGTRRDPAGVRHKRRGRKERLPFLSRRLQCGFGFPAKLPIHRRSPERRRVRRSTNTSRTTSASEKGWRTPLIS